VAGVLKIFRRRCRDRCGQFVLRVGNNKRDVPNGQADLHQPARQRPCVRHRPARLPRHRRVSILKGRSHKASIPDERAAEATGMVVFDPVAYFFRRSGRLGDLGRIPQHLEYVRRAAIPFQDSPRDRGRSRDRPARARQVSSPTRSSSNRRIAERIRRAVATFEPDLMRPISVGEAHPVVFCHLEAAARARIGHDLSARHSIRIELIVPR
jgi:hypothetical protein